MVERRAAKLGYSGSSPVGGSFRQSHGRMSGATGRTAGSKNLYLSREFPREFFIFSKKAPRLIG